MLCITPKVSYNNSGSVSEIHRDFKFSKTLFIISACVCLHLILHVLAGTWIYYLHLSDNNQCYIDGVILLLGDISLVGQLEKDAVLMAQEDAVKGLEAMKLLLGYCAILDIKDKVGDH